MRALVLVIACVAAGAHAQATKRFGDNPCLTQGGAQACEKLANDVSHDIGAVRALGDELERSGRFEDAAVAYRVALTVHPEHRDLLQRLIRVRGQARSLRLLAPGALASSAAPGSASPAATGGGPLAGRASPAAPKASALAGSVARPPGGTPPVAAGDANRGAALEASAPAAPVGRYLALVIGNERYSQFTALKTPMADAQAIATLLKNDYGFATTVLNNATRYQIVSALSQLRREATENDSVLIYYAGHGYLDETTSRGYWLPVDAERDNVANWLSTSDITDVLAGLQARHALILADSCFSGTLLRSDPTVALDERQSMLRKLATRRSRSIMTSGGLEPVTDNGGGKHSIFAAALLRALRDNRQLLEAGRLFMQIRDRVSRDAIQTPQYGPLRNAGHDGGDFIFARNKH
jgi:uncharacterized caspase-like protein